MSELPLYSMIIDGKPVLAATTFDVINPASGAAFARVAAGDATHVDAAVAAARAAFPGWAALPDGERSRLIGALAEVLQANMPELMRLVTLETGKPQDGLNHVGAGMEVGGAIAWTQATSQLALPVEVVQDNAEARVEVHRKPLGVVGSITPWNWPLMIAIWHIMPALRAGNTVVLKPSELTPVTTARFVELANAVLPPGVLNLVTGAAGSAVGPAMTTHPGIEKIVFTGSTATGRKIMGNAAATLKRLTLELGGNDAGIVLPDVDVKAVAPKLFAAAFHNNGQTCACLKRLYVHADMYDELCAELVALARAVKVGDGFDPASELGPIQNRMQLEKVEAIAADAHRAGGQFLCGGERLPGPGYFYAPTIVVGLDEGSRLVDEEPFGPILPVIKYSDVDEVIVRANRNSNGLGGSIWARDLVRAAALASRLECGTVWVNEHGAVQPDAPFGGIKQSGIGVEFGLHGLAEFTSIQTIKVMQD
ncbi:aldehyde dehydrogenase family protein [Quatrionicoccus australiensis]|uniref:aldehyde dehydrogenase family protein n=1 Tax=Quatrionicoccus australiensis TaxID=138118 RepID=UPI001CFB56D9|nr:aldehyde dehydrogenase family protein [Quatrionicoccus australiensis]MCB4358729.1 aldehyde dehydrogenase family protein [Quatrionicoccus australiensis]